MLSAAKNSLVFAPFAHGTELYLNKNIRMERAIQFLWLVPCGLFLKNQTDEPSLDNTIEPHAEVDAFATR